MDWNYILFSLGMIILFGGLLLWALMGVSKKASEFYEGARVLEMKIKTQDDKDDQVRELFELNELSFHRTTGHRMRELAKMLELKYNIKLTK